MNIDTKPSNPEPLYIQHYGIKGMKWGVRREDPSKTAATLTDAELKKRTRRLQLEKQYVDLVNQKNERDASVLEKGSKIVGKLVLDAAKENTKQAFSFTMKTTGKKLYKQYFPEIDKK